MNLYARQGDLVIEQIPASSTKPNGGTMQRDAVIAGGSSGHVHRLLGPAKIERTGRTVFVEIVEPTQLVHEKAGGHLAVQLTAGRYEIRPLRERGDGADRQMED